MNNNDNNNNNNNSNNNDNNNYNFYSAFSTSVFKCALRDHYQGKN